MRNEPAVAKPTPPTSPHKISVTTDNPPALIDAWYDTQKFQSSFTQRKWEVTHLDDVDSHMIWFLMVLLMVQQLAMMKILMLAFSSDSVSESD